LALYKSIYLLFTHRVDYLMVSCCNHNHLEHIACLCPVITHHHLSQHFANG